MKTQQNGLFRYFVIVAFSFVLLRFFPLVVRAVQGVAVGVRSYWWAVLPALVVGWLVLKARRSKAPSAVDEARDVTDSNP